MSPPLAPRMLRWAQDLWKICAPVMYVVSAEHLSSFIAWLSHHGSQDGCNVRNDIREYEE